MNAFELIRDIAEQAGVSLDIELDLGEQKKLESLQVNIAAGEFNPTAWNIDKVWLESEAYHEHGDAYGELDPEYLDHLKANDQLWIVARGQVMDSPYAPSHVMR